MIRKAMFGLALACSVEAASAAAPNRVTLPFGQKVFVSGINVAWKGFGGDVGKYPVDTAWFAKMLQGVSDSGGNAVRWWLFTNCSNDPQIDSTTKLVKGMEPNTIANVRKVLDMAYARGISISLCLLSFDMMKTNQIGADIAANKKILQTDEGRKAFLDNAVVPLVKAIGKHPAILDWEIFNEPEGMVKSIAGDWGSISDGIEISHVQKMVNQAAGAIHRAMPGVPVSNGCWAFIAGSNTIPGDHNYYSDSALKAVGGDSDGTLDFYMVHYYEWAGTERSPFHHPASYWGLDKPLVIGEFPAKGLSDKVGPMTPAQCWKYLYDNGYAGAMGWTYTAHDGFGGLPEAGEGMRALKTLAPSEVTLDFPPSSADDWFLDTASKTLRVAAPGVLANDVEPTPGQILSAALVSDASHGKVSLAADGSFTYLPQASWTGTDRFTYRAVGGGGMADTSTVVVRVLDPAKGTFFAPPRAAQWKIYGGWGKLSVADAPDGLAAGNPQWGPTSVWLVGTGVPTTISGTEQTVSILVKNDPGSPWAGAKFHLAKASAVGAYGPADSASLTVDLVAQDGDLAGFTELRAKITAPAGEYLPSVELVWKDADGNGPNVDHTSLVRDLEIYPTADFAARGPSTHPHALAWNTAGNTLRIQCPGRVALVVTDLAGREVARREALDELSWPLPSHGGILLARVVSAEGARSIRLFAP